MRPVDDIVIESGTGRYQDVVDRFVRGDDVPIEALRHAWEDTVSTTPGWERRIYEAVIRASRITSTPSSTSAPSRPWRRLAIRDARTLTTSRCALHG